MTAGGRRPPAVNRRGRPGWLRRDDGRVDAQPGGEHAGRGPRSTPSRTASWIASGMLAAEVFPTRAMLKYIRSRPMARLLGEIDDHALVRLVRDGQVGGVGEGPRLAGGMRQGSADPRSFARGSVDGVHQAVWEAGAGRDEVDRRAGLEHPRWNRCVCKLHNLQWFTVAPAERSHTGSHNWRA